MSCPNRVNSQVITLNDYQTKRFADRVVRTLFNSLTGKKIALFGFAFKKNTGDTRESAAIKLVKSFLLEGGKVDIFDPKVTEQQIWHELVTPDNNLDTRTHSNLLRMLIMQYGHALLLLGRLMKQPLELRQSSLLRNGTSFVAIRWTTKEFTMG